jgi:hypothetical protein
MVMSRRGKLTGIGIGIGTAFALPGVAHADPFVVDVGGDAGDGTCAPASCTLRDAVDDAASDTDPSTITFAASLSGSTITLNGSGPLDASGQLMVTGLGAKNLTISGDDADRVFDAGTGASLTLNDITLTHGDNGGGDGGAVYGNDADVALSRVVITDSYASSDGGAVAVDNGSLTMADSTISGNASGDQAGGVFVANYAAPNQSAAITGSTITGNESPYGAGVYVASYLGAGYGPILTQLDDLTVSGNTAGDFAGGVYLSGIGVGSRIRNSIISGNAAASGMKDLGVYPAAIPASFSLLGSVGSGDVIESPVGSNIFATDPGLAPLADNGGPTPTRSLLATSRGLDKGSAFGVAHDQRGAGFPRTVDLSGAPNGFGSDGTDIGAFEDQTAPPGLPSGSLTLKSVKRNKRKGTATLTVEAPGPGRLDLYGQDVANTTMTTSGPGTFELLVRTKGKPLKRLRHKGRVRVGYLAIFWPTLNGELAGVRSYVEDTVQLIKSKKKGKKN